MLLTQLLLVVELLCAGTTCAWHDTGTGVTVPVPPGIQRAADLSKAGTAFDSIKKACAAQDSGIKFIRDPVTNRRVRNGCFGNFQP